MSKTCSACKTRDAIMTVSIADSDTGVFSSPLPVCEECMHRISKLRPLKIASSQSPSYLAGTLLSPNKTTTQSIAPRSSDDYPAWQRTIWRIQKIFRILFYIHIALITAGAVAIHILNLASEALEQYWKSQK